MSSEELKKLKLLAALKAILKEAERPTDPALMCAVIKWTALEAIEEAPVVLSCLHSQDFLAAHR